MARRKPKTGAEPASEETAGGFTPPPTQESQIFSGGPSLHDMFQQQVRHTLDQSDLDEDAKQAILVALSCPCCGAGGMNYTAKITRRTK
jgi:hypothetical protein